MSDKTESQNAENVAITKSDADARIEPWVELRSVRDHVYIFERMVAKASPKARQGDCVAVYDRHGMLLGRALYNPRSRIALRMLTSGDEPVDDAFWKSRIADAAQLRIGILHLSGTTDAYRLIHAEADGLSGLIVDRYDDTLSVEVFSVGMWRNIERILELLHEAVGTKHHIAVSDERAAHLEGYAGGRILSEGGRSSLKISENGVRFKVRFDGGHKTGFFCDQRENRLRLTRYTRSRDVLDLCCYGGGFGLYAKVKGEAKSVTCVDLDEFATALTRENANLNQMKVDVVQADAFTYMRQMEQNNRKFGVIVLDPPKLVFGRNDTEGGQAKYADMNRLAAGLVERGGLLLTCSCSGAVGRDDFLHWVTSAVRRAGRSCQILEVTGAGTDHPVSPKCPETEYLKAVWLRIL